jgi:hypothetical protein
MLRSDFIRANKAGITIQQRKKTVYLSNTLTGSSICCGNGSHLTARNRRRLDKFIREAETKLGIR